MAGSAASVHIKAQDGLEPPHRYWAMMTIAIGIAMAVMDNSLVILALPLIARDFGAEPGNVVWVVGAFQLTITVSLFPLAALGDKWGCRRIYLGGILLFLAASVLCAFAQSLPQLIAARILQGIGASAIMSVNLALVRFIFPSGSLGQGVAFNTLVVGLAASAGPSIAAVILSYAAWPWMFLVNIPLGLMAVAIGQATLPQTPLRPQSLRTIGIGLSVIAFGGLALALDSIGRGQPALITAGLVLLSVISFAGLYRYERTVSDPVVPFDLLGGKSIRIAALIACLTYVVQGLSFTALPFYMHDGLGYTPAQIGLSMTPWALAIVVCSPLAGRLSDRYSTPAVTTVGLLILTMGVVSLMIVPAMPSVESMMLRTAICGIGFALFQVPNSKAIVVGAPRHRSAAASAIQSAARLSGQALGAALVAMTFNIAAGGATRLAAMLAVGFAASAFLVSASRLSAHRT